MKSFVQRTVRAVFKKFGNPYFLARVGEILQKESLFKAIFIIALKSIKIPSRKFARGISTRLYLFLNVFILPTLRRSYSKNISKMEPESQLFLVARGDFGSLLLLLHYIGCWQRKRGSTSVVFLTAHFKLSLLKSLSQDLCPQASFVYYDKRWFQIVISLFGEELVHLCTFSKIYAQLATEYPHALFLFEQPTGILSYENFLTRSRYIRFLDKELERFPHISPFFRRAYLEVRKIYDYRFDVYVDFIHLHSQDQVEHPQRILKAQGTNLCRTFGIDNQYVVININCKKYSRNESLNRKEIANPFRYNSIIDSLIERGYSVVLQGRGEQPELAPRKGFFDYSRSPFCSIANDIRLYSGATFAISSKSGPENFSTICHVPLLGLEYVELCSMTPNKALRFYPKHIRKKSSGKLLSWEELLESPCFFDLGIKNFEPDIEYVSLQEEEMLAALQEFLSLVEGKNTDWNNLSPLQIEFKQKLIPLHLDLFHVPGVPCNTYLLRNSKSR